jgi:Protein of unknown function (DUF3592)
MPSAGILIAIAIALFVLASFLYTTVKMVVAFDPAIVLSARGTCQIKVSRVQHFYNPWAAVGSSIQARQARNEEKAQVTYTLLTTGGRTFQGSSYDWMDDVRVSEAPDQDQAIVNQYQVGHSYPCWYNPLFPSMSALRQSVDWSVDPLSHATFLFTVGGFVWVIVLLIGIPIATVMTITRSWSWSHRKTAP